MQNVLSFIRRAVPPATDQSDSDLLARVVASGDDAAFAALLRRHGPLVLSVCRRVLGHPQDAEDAFQATFLALASQAGAVARRESISSWLHRVAYRTALKARNAVARRRRRERQVDELPHPAVLPTVAEDWSAVHEELDRLPEKYGAALVLCDLQGRSRREAAALLGVPEGTLSSRLAMGRRMLRERLALRGVTLAAGAMVVSHLVPPALASSTVSRAALVVAGRLASVKGVMKAMALSMVLGKTFLRAAAGVALIAALLGGAWWAWPRPLPAPDAAPHALLDGRWRCVGVEADGKLQTGWLTGAMRLRLTIAGDTFAIPRWFAADSTFTLPDSPANAIDIHTRSHDGRAVLLRGILSLDGDTLRLGIALDPDRPRPTSFQTKAGDGRNVYVFERVKPGEERPETAAEKLGNVIEEALRGNRLPADRVAPLAERCLEIARSSPGTDEAVVSLLWVMANAPYGEAGKSALGLLRDGEVAGASLETLAMCFGIGRGTIGPGDIPDRINLELAPLLLERARRAPDDPRAAEVLSSVCSICKDRGSAEVSPLFAEAARMIAERWTTSPDITHFLEALSTVRQRPWAGRYEATVRSILAKTPNGYIRNRAAFTLAQLVAETGEDRQEEARELYVRFVNGYRPEVVDPSWKSVAEDLVAQARREIDGLLIRGIGGPAPDLKGVDMDGKPIALREYRGKVVLLSFWATWCGPCMRLIPHERALREQLKGRPFDVVGVNGDDLDKLNRKLLDTNPVPWRSFQNKRRGQKPIAREWNLVAWPTLFLIDHTGKIRRQWIGTPPLGELDGEVRRWVAVAEGKPLAPPARTGGGAEASAPAGKTHPARFIDKVYTAPRGGESKYAVCIPENHDGKTPLPVVLFLHGSGQVGTDNKEQLKIGLGPAIRKRGMPFAFIGVFPQARDGPWRADSPDGKRALAILEAVEREYPTDKKRVYLTGVSMGAEGVWSLAAKHPKRFAAIVPVCGGGKPKLANALKDVPCWAFHGDADKVVPVQASRDLVRAITEAGGRPQYQEYRDLGHNCWDRAYAEVELYRWLQAQALE